MDPIWIILTALAALGLAVHTLRSASEVEAGKRLGRASTIMFAAGAGLALVGELTEWRYPVFGAILGTGFVELVPNVMPTVFTAARSAIVRFFAKLGGGS